MQVWELEKNKRCSVRTFKGRTQIDLREWYTVSVVWECGPYASAWHGAFGAWHGFPKFLDVFWSACILGRILLTVLMALVFHWA